MLSWPFINCRAGRLVAWWPGDWWRHRAARKVQIYAELEHQLVRGVAESENEGTWAISGRCLLFEMLDA